MLWLIGVKWLFSVWVWKELLCFVFHLLSYKLLFCLNSISNYLISSLLCALLLPQKRRNQSSSVFPLPLSVAFSLPQALSLSSNPHNLVKADITMACHQKYSLILYFSCCLLSNRESLVRVSTTSEGSLRRPCSPVVTCRNAPSSLRQRYNGNRTKHSEVFHCFLCLWGHFFDHLGLSRYFSAALVC